MSNLLKYQGFWKYDDVSNDNDHNYLYGDNLEKYGTAGQAVIRFLPNAYGIPTKIKPTMNSNAFMTDDDFDWNVKKINSAFDAVPLNKDVYISESGLGTGLAKLDQKAPLTYKYLQKRLRQLERDLNNYSH